VKNQVGSYFQTQCFVVVPHRGTEMKLNVGIQTQTFKYPTISKPFVNSNSLKVRLHPHNSTLFTVQKCHGHKKMNFLMLPTGNVHKSIILATEIKEVHATLHFRTFFDSPGALVKILVKMGKNVIKLIFSE